MLSFFKNSAGLFKKQQQDILSAAFIIGFSVAASGVLGLVRYRLLASYFGSDIKLLDSFIAASVLPDAIFEVLIFGTIALAFIPVFSQYINNDDLKKAWSLTSKMISLGLLVFAIFTIFMLFFAKQIAPLIAPGVIGEYPQSQLIIARLLQIMTVGQFFFVFSIFITGILQSFQRFLVPALASVFYNVGIILAIIFLSPALGIYAPAVGMVIGALLHLLIQIPMATSLGYKFHLDIDFKSKDVKDMFALMWPRTVALGILRLSDVINISLASLAAAGTIVAFNFAQVLQLEPVSLFAASLAQAALPALALQYNAKKFNDFKKTFTESLHQILFLILPTAAILAVLRIPVVRLVFGARELPWEVTVLTGRTLIAFSIGIAAQSVSLLLLRGYHATRDSMTPVKINIASVVINIAMSVVFIKVLHLSVIYLALAYSTANIINALLMLYVLDKKVNFNKKEVLTPAIKMILISAITAVALYIPMKFLDQLVFDTTKTVGLLLLTSLATLVGLIVYISLSIIFKVKEVAIFFNLARRVILLPAKLSKPTIPPIEVQEKT